MSHCADVMSAMDGYTMAVEFRNQTWFDEKRRDSTLAMERERELVNVVVDEPQGASNSIPAVWETTNPQTVRDFDSACMGAIRIT